MSKNRASTDRAKAKGVKEAARIFARVKAGDPQELALCNALRKKVPPLRRVP